MRYSIIVEIVGRITIKGRCHLPLDQDVSPIVMRANLNDLQYYPFPQGRVLPYEMKWD